MAKLSSSNGKKVNVPKLRFPEFTEEWEASNIGEISTYIKGAPLSKADISETGTPLILYGELYTTYKEVATEIKRKTNCIVDNKYFSKIGDVVIPTSGETPEEIATATCVMTPNVILAGDLNIFRINDIDGRFFSYVINHKANKDISRIAQGKSIVHIKGEEISKLQIKYPSAEEQQKILSFIELLSLKIEKQEQLIDKLKKYKRGALSSLFPKKGEITPQYRFAGFAKPWEQRELGDVLSLLKDGTHGTHKDSDEGVFLLSAKNIKNGKVFIDENTDRKISKQEFDSIHSNFRLHENDVLLTIVGSIGEVAMLENPDIMTFQRSVAFLRPKDNLSSTFLKTEIETDYFQKELSDRKSQSAQPGVYLGELEKIPFILPNVVEQKQIGSFFSNLDNLIIFHQHKCDSLLSLKNALLQQMFI